MSQLHPIAVVLPGAQRWHRTEVIRYAAGMGLIPILTIQPGEEVVVEGDVQPLIGGVLTLPEQPSEQDLQRVAERLNHLCMRWYVLPLDDYITELSARLSQYATVACYPLAAAREAFHKHLLRKRWNAYCHAQSHLPLQAVPWALYLNGEQVEADQGFESSHGPFIVKPNAYSGSVGVTWVVDKERLPAAIARCADILDKEAQNPEMRGITIDRHVLVELAAPRQQHLGGCAEYTAHYLTFGGKHLPLGIAEKQIDSHTFVETAHLYPSPSFPHGLKETLHRCVTDLMTDMQVQHTISNWEFIVTPDNRLAMVEGQLRPSGDHVMELIELASLHSPFSLFFRSLDLQALPVDGFPCINSSIICWPRPAEPLQRVSHISVPSKLPKGLALHVDQPALMAARNWAGPATWYDRHLAVVSTAPTANGAWQQVQRTLHQCQLTGTHASGHHATTGLVFP